MYRNVPQPPWCLAHICRTWRHASLVDPLLWNSLHIQWGTLGPVARNFPSSMIETFYTRSATAPLAITLRSIGDTFDPVWSSSLLSQCHRWSTLRITSWNSGPILDLLRPVKDCLSSLRTLEFVLLRRDDVPPSSGWDIFSEAPRLREVVLTDESCLSSVASPSISIPWDQITRYRGSYSPAAQLEILRAAPNLVECSLGLLSVDY